MSATTPAIERAKVVRWPAIILLAATVILMIALDDRTEGSSEAIALERATVPTAGEPGSLGSTWYCAGGTIVEDSVADHTLAIANPSAQTAAVELTVFPVLAPTPVELNLDAEAVADELSLEPPEAIDLGAVAVSVEVAPQTVERFRVGDLEGVGGEHAAVLVESSVGELLVEHIVAGPTGAGLSPCASTSADQWQFAAGTTRSGAQEWLTIFNPFPGDAVVDLTFTTDGSVRTPQIYNGLVVPSGTVLPVDITGVVTLFDIVSADVQVRTGRVITDRLLSVDGENGPGGLSVALGAAAPAQTWVFASSGPAEATDALAIANFTTEEASVDVEVYLDLPEFNGSVEPTTVTIRPGRTEVVVLSAGAELVTPGRVVDSSDRILDDVGFWAAVRSNNGVPVVADRFTFAASPTPVATSASPGAPIAATSHVMTSGDGVGEIVVVNPADDRIVQVEALVSVDGQQFRLETAEVTQQSRLVIDLAASGVPADALIQLETSDPVLLERRLALAEAGQVTAVAVPVAGSASAPQLPIG